MIVLNKNWIAVCWRRRWIWWIRCGRSWRHFDVLLWWCLYCADAEKSHLLLRSNKKKKKNEKKSRALSLLEQNKPPLLTPNLSSHHAYSHMRVTHRACLWPCVVVNHSIASRHKICWFDMILLAAWEQFLANVADELLLIFRIFVWWSCHVTVTQCRWQWWRWVASVHADCFVLVLFEIGDVEIFVVATFWSVKVKERDRL